MKRALTVLLFALLWIAATLFVLWAGHASASALTYNCEGHKVTLSADRLIIDDSAPVPFTDKSPAIGQHSDGTFYQATTWSFSDEYFLVVGDDDSTAALIDIRRDKSLFCEKQ